VKISDNFSIMGLLKLIATDLIQKCINIIVRNQNLKKIRVILLQIIFKILGSNDTLESNF